MAREWQQTKMTDYIMPDTVYYQTLWAVRDLSRMEKRLKELKKGQGSPGSASVIKERKSSYGSSRVEDMALEQAVLEERIEGIRGALMQVPDPYRSYVMSNIVLKNSGATFPNKTWRNWKQKFLYNVARNLSMM